MSAAGVRIRFCDDTSSTYLDSENQDRRAITSDNRYCYCYCHCYCYCYCY